MSTSFCYKYFTAEERFILIKQLCMDDYVEKNPSIKVHRVNDPLFFKSKFNFSQTVGEMVFVSFEV